MAKARIIEGVRTLAGRLATSRDGGVAMLFALALPPLLLMTVAGVDLHRASTVQQNLRDALDAAALAGARSNATTDQAVTAIALPVLRANLQAYPDITLKENLTTFHLTSAGVVEASSKVDVKTLVANIFLPPYGKFMDDKLQVGATSEVKRSSRNVEVSLVLDITGSMTNGKIDELKEAAEELVDIVVQTNQSPFYSKMAIVPYSMGVNLSTYANGARGSLTGGRAISGAAWASSAKSVSSVNRNSQATITANSHGFANGDIVWLSGVANMSGINGRPWQVSNRSGNAFKLKYPGTNTYLNTSGFSSNGSGGTASKCLMTDCSVVVTANAHGLANGDYVYIAGVKGMTEINNGSSVVAYQVSAVTTDSYSIGVNGAGWGAYTSGGMSYCGEDGCQYRIFANAYGDLSRFDATSCASERTGGSAYTDASPSSSRTGRVYTAPGATRTSGNACPDSTLMPLSSSIASLKSKISGLQIGGSTAGQIGAAWGWYTLAPNFNSLWPSASQAAAYNNDVTLKAVVLMTDGEFNTPYCGGVVARNALSGSGGYDVKINCNATNGSAFAQAKALCDAMQAKGIIVYTVGFQVADEGDAADIMRECASEDDYAYLPSNGDDLTEAFRAIGRDITRLRISK